MCLPENTYPAFMRWLVLNSHEWNSRFSFDGRLSLASRCPELSLLVVALFVVPLVVLVFIRWCDDIGDGI